MASMPAKDLKRRFEFCRRGGYEPLPLQINGLVFRPDDELKELLLEKKEAGFKSLSLTLAGLGRLHDLWCGRRGEYDFLMRIATLAGEIGFPRLEKLFLTESSWSGLPELIDSLSRIPGEVRREVQTVSYVGWARALEKERLTTATWEAQPGTVRDLVNMEGLKTESGWLELIDGGLTDPEPESVFLMIRLREHNLDKFEQEDCQEIIDDLKKKQYSAWDALPALDRLAREFGDKRNDRFYHLRELRRKWLDMYLKIRPDLAGYVKQIYSLP
jgi:hypothetical protein